MSFVHLNTKSGYSFFNSTLRLDDIINSNNDYISLVDNSAMFMTLELFKKAKDKKIIIGMEVNVSDENLESHPLVLLAKGLEGYKTLCRLTRNISGSNNYILSFDELQNYKDNIIAILPSSRANNVLGKIAKYKDVFSDFYVGLEYYDSSDINLISNIRSLNVKRVVLTNDTIKENDLESLKILKCIELGITLNELNYEFKVTSIDDESYLSMFSDEEINETENIAKRCVFNVFDLKGHLYNIKIEDKENYFKALCYKGLEKRGCYTQKYIDRLEYELGIITKMGFTNYFLVVQDYVRFAKQNDILVGPGRGSAAGSLVAYVLGITNVDPLKYNLLFERFLNPERVTMPDIDLDFVDEKREQVIDYLVDKYGFEHVSHVIAFQTFGARQAIRDVAKVYGLSLVEVDMISKRIPSIYRDNKLIEIYNNFYSFKAFINSKDIYRQILKTAMKIEGLPRQTTLHAAGIIISDEPLYEVCPVYLSGNTLVSQYDKDYIEDIGLLKMDILALKNLTTIEDTIRLIGKPVDLSEKILDDSHIYDLIRSTLTSGVFQLESGGMKKAIRTLKPTCFEDVVALLALFRPGPMENIPEYALIKEGKKKATYIDDCLKDILEPTYGIIIYQEQIMQILTKMAGFSLGKADLARRAIGKKNEQLLISIRSEFIEGSIKNHHSEEVANKVFDLIYKFANYGFNKAHSVSYAMISCEMAYLKYYYRVEFFTSLLNNSLGNIQSLAKLDDYVYEINRLNIKILLPDINKSKYEFSVEDNNIRFALSSISGLNNLVVSNILKERKEGNFKSFLDFVVRMQKYKISSAILNVLINSGCFDNLVYKLEDKTYSREALRNAIEVSLHYGSMIGSEDQLQFSDFITKPSINECENDELRNFNLEYMCLGIALSISPVFKYKDNSFDSLKHLSRRNVKLLVCVSDFRVIKTKKGNYMGIAKVFDDTSFGEVVLFDEAFQKFNNLFKLNEYLVIEGEYSNRGSTIVNNVRKVEF